MNLGDEQTRRWFLQSLLGSSALSLAGCSFPGSDVTPLPPRSAPGTVDIHAHVFNARDIPAVGFFEHILSNEPDAPLNDPDLLTALVALAVEIVRLDVSTPQEELNRLTPRALVARATEATDQQKVANGINRFVAMTRDQPTDGLEAAIVVQDASSAAVPTEEQADQLLQEIAIAAGLPPEPEALVVGPLGAEERLQPPPPDGDTLAAAIYGGPPAEPAFEALVIDDSPQPQQSRSVGVNSSNLVQTLRWIGLLTRDREDILDQFLDFYGVDDSQAAAEAGPDTTLPGVTVISPSIVDFDAWLVNPFRGIAGDPEPIPDQVAVMSAIAQRRRSILMLNFVGFCPLRMALKHEAAPAADRPGLYLEEVQDALAQGFVGVKVYPPMGFRPVGNAGQPRPVNAGPDGIPWFTTVADGWERIDEALMALYAFCEANNVPIKAHANNSLGAQPCSSLNANPANWTTVLKMFPDLRLNLAHFGGFEETLDPPQVCTSDGDWEATLAKMLSPENKLYIDIGFWDEVSDPQSRAAILAKMDRLIARYPLLRERLMYGSDWTMLAQVPGNEGYLNDVHDALTDLDWGGSAAENAAVVRAIERDNALTYLGLREDTPRRAALATFFAGNPVFERIVSGL